MAKPYGYDIRSGTRYCLTTETGPGMYEDGSQIREKILDAGDFSGQLRDTDDGPYWDKKLPITALGAKRI